MARSDSGAEGLLLVDKPDGPTSHDVVRAVRKALGTRRVGHAGTLDPFATGLLACCAGQATRLLRWLTSSDKTYEGVIRFGFATDTGDRTGRPCSEPRDAAVAADDAAREAGLALTGDILQVPPMYSAKKRDGVALHELARRGEVVEREAVPVRVTGWRFEPAGEGRLAFRVTCSAGTYVRVLASELGERLGCGAHLDSLRRVRSGALRVEDAVPLASLDRETADRALIPLDALPLPLPRAELAAREPDDAALVAWGHGRIIDPASFRWTEAAPAAGVGAGASAAAEPAEPAEIAVVDAAGRLRGVARLVAGGLQPIVVLAR